MDDFGIDDDDNTENSKVVDLDIVKMESPTEQYDSDNNDYTFFIDANGKLQQSSLLLSNDEKDVNIKTKLKTEIVDEEYIIDYSDLPTISDNNNLTISLSIDHPSKPMTQTTPDKKQKEIIKCSICPQIFPTKSNLVEHIKSHFKTMTCEICQKQFVGDIKLKYHLKTAHKKKPINSTIKCNFPCVICNEVFSTKSNLKSHRNEKHKSLTSSATCAYCYGQFFDMDCLNEHMKIVHSNEMENPVACDVCARICSNQAAVDRHRQTHFIETKEFICDFCKKGFTRKTNLSFHMRIHTGERPFKCKQCPKSFSHISGLNCHERVHTGERPYKCPFCDKCFIHSTDLRRHRRTHGNEEKRFECSLCSAKFYERKFLKIHMKTHSKNDKKLLSVNLPYLMENKMITIQMEVQKQIKNKKGKSLWK